MNVASVRCRLPIANCWVRNDYVGSIPTGNWQSAIIYWLSGPNLRRYSDEFMNPFTIVRKSVGFAFR